MTSIRKVTVALNVFFKSGEWGQRVNPCRLAGISSLQIHSVNAVMFQNAEWTAWQVKRKEIKGCLMLPSAIVQLRDFSYLLEGIHRLFRLKLELQLSWQQVRHSDKHSVWSPSGLLKQHINGHSAGLAFGLGFHPSEVQNSNLYLWYCIIYTNMSSFPPCILIRSLFVLFAQCLSFSLWLNTLLQEVKVRGQVSCDWDV